MNHDQLETTRQGPQDGASADASASVDFSAPAATSASSGTVALMGACYALGTFTDNCYKQAAILLAAASQATSVQSIATVVFSLPFVVFSAWAGWLADRAPKKYIVVAAKALELFAMLFGAFMLVTANWTGILVVLCIMGSQATLFGPAINGSIPENFPARHVPRVNALIKLASTAAILAGMALAGVFLDAGPDALGGLLPALPLDEGLYGRGLAGLILIALSVIGLATALLLRKRPAASGPGRTAPFPLAGPLDSVRHVLDCRRDKALFLVLLAEAWFYGIAAIAVISVANLAAALGYSNTLAGGMSAMLMIGVALGSLLAGRGTPESWKVLLVPAALGMALMLSLVGLAPLLPGGSWQLAWIFIMLFCSGFCGGLYLIPLASFIQVRPPAEAKGRVIGVSNFLSFMAMAVFGAAFQIISLLPPALTFPVYGLATLLFVALLSGRGLSRLSGRSMREAAVSPLGLLLRALLGLRYTVSESGLDSLPAPERNAGGRKGAGVLFLPNHPALIDPVLVYSRLAGLRPRPLADARQMRGPLQRLAALIVGAVTIPDMEKDGRRGADRVRQGILNITRALQRGENVLLYPAGRIYRSGRESLRSGSAAARILAAVPDARVVLVRTTGLWGSRFGHASGKSPSFMRELGLGLCAVLSNALFFTPRRKVRMEFVEPADLPRDGDKKILNAYLEAFYNHAGEEEALTVPRHFRQRR